MGGSDEADVAYMVVVKISILLYLALRNQSKKWGTMQRWRESLNRFQILWPDRMPALERR